jgi:DNA polymerase V
VLSKPYSAEKAKLIVREMTDQLVLDMVRKRVVADQIVLNIGYDHTGIPEDYSGRLVLNHYGKKAPKPAHGSVNLGKHTASTKIILSAMMQLCDQILDKELLVRQLNVAVNHVIYEKDMHEEDAPMQYGLFDDVDALEKKREQEKIALAKERKLQEAMLAIKGKYGKNAVLKGMDFQEDATARERNGQVGGHRA